MLKLPSWWLNTACSPAPPADQTPPFSKCFVPLPSLYSQWIWNWEGSQAHPVKTAAKAMLYVLLIPSSPGGQPWSPHWEVRTGENTPHSLVIGGEALNCAAFFGWSLFLYCYSTWSLSSFCCFTDGLQADPELCLARKRTCGHSLWPKMNSPTTISQTPQGWDRRAALGPTASC